MGDSREYHLLQQTSDMTDISQNRFFVLIDRQHNIKTLSDGRKQLKTQHMANCRTRVAVNTYLRLRVGCNFSISSKIKPVRNSHPQDYPVQPSKQGAQPPPRAPL